MASTNVLPRTISPSSPASAPTRQALNTHALPRVLLQTIAIGAAWILSLPLSTLAQDVATGSAAPAETEIRQLLEQQVTDWNAGDIDGFMQAYWKSEALTFSSSGQTTRGWQATRDRYRTRYATQEMMGKLSFSELEFQEVGAGGYLVLGRWRLERANDQPHGNFSLVLRRFEEGWRIIHDHTSLTP